MRLVLGTLLAAGLATAVCAEDAETARLRELAAKEKQQELMDLPSRVSALEKKAEKADGRISLKDGLKFKSDDGNFTAHVGGRYVGHYRWHMERPDTSRAAVDSFYTRQAKLETSGTFMKQFEYKAQLNMASATATWGRTRLDDGYVGWTKIPELSIRFGQFKEPFSQEELCSTRFIDFVERSVLNRLVPGRDIGVMIHGSVEKNLFEYALALYNGSGQNTDDVNDEKDLCIQLRTTPFAGTDMGYLKGLRLGVAGTFGDADNASIGALDFTTTELQVQFMDATTGNLDSLQTRLGVELSYLYGPMSLRAEYIVRNNKVDAGSNDDEKIKVDGWYVAGTYLLTGETKALENRVKPDAPLDLDGGGFGAVELAARIAQLKVSDDIFDLGVASAATNADKVTTITVGVNWWLWNNFRFSPNFIYEKYSEDILSSRHVDPTNKALGMLFRVQADF